MLSAVTYETHPAARQEYFNNPLMYFSFFLGSIPPPDDCLSGYAAAKSIAPGVTQARTLAHMPGHTSTESKFVIELKVLLKDFFQKSLTCIAAIISTAAVAST